MVVWQFLWLVSLRTCYRNKFDMVFQKIKKWKHMGEMIEWGMAWKTIFYLRWFWLFIALIVYIAHNFYNYLRILGSYILIQNCFFSVLHAKYVRKDQPVFIFVLDECQYICYLRERWRLHEEWSLEKFQSDEPKKKKTIRIRRQILEPYGGIK